MLFMAVLCLCEESRDGGVTHMIHKTSFEWTSHSKRTMTSSSNIPYFHSVV